jgi:transcriptional regulator with XRE-family HTH domain
MSVLHERLQAVAGSLTYRNIAELTKTHPETVRRYMQGHAPSVEFLAAVCTAMGISAEWLLTGRGPMRTSDLKTHALKEANPAELLTAVANTLQQLQERVERLEIFVQTLEARIRAVQARPTSETEFKPDGTPPAHPGAQRARSVADALPARSRADAR